MKCLNNFIKLLDGFLATPIITSWLVLAKRRTLIYLFQQEVLPLLQNVSQPPSHDCEVLNCSLDFHIPWITKSIQHLQSARHSVVLHPQKTLPTPLPDFRLSLVVGLVPYLSRAFSFDTDPTTSSRGTTPRARTYEGNMTAEHVYSWHCDEPKAFSRQIRELR